MRLVKALPGDSEAQREREKPEKMEVCKAFRCQACERTFQSIDLAAMHMLRIHCSVGLQCPCCETVSGEVASLRAHVEAAHKEERDYKDGTPGCVWCLCGIQHETFNNKRH